MPGAGVQREHTVTEKLCALSTTPVAPEGRSADAGIDAPAPFPDAHAAPTVRPARSLPRLVSPRVVAKFARLWHGVEDPSTLAGARVPPPDVTGCFRIRRVASTSACDDDVFEDDHR